jgi:hypothetical protein
MLPQRDPTRRKQFTTSGDSSKAWAPAQVDLTTTVAPGAATRRAVSKPEGEPLASTR